MKELEGKTSKDFTYTQKEWDFCHALAATGNQREAYRTAYATNTSNIRTASVKANKLLKKDKIRVLCEEIRADLQKRNEITLDEVIRDLASMVRFDIADLYEENGDLKNIHDMPKEARQMIASMDIEALYEGYGEQRTQVGHVKKIKLVNRMDVFEKMMKYFDGYNKHNKSKKPNAQVMIIQLPDNQRDPTEEIIDIS